MNINLNSPQGYLALLLFGGLLLVLLGNGIETFTADVTLANQGWMVVVVSIVLWIFARLLGSRRD